MSFHYRDLVVTIPTEYDRCGQATAPIDDLGICTLDTVRPGGDCGPATVGYQACGQITAPTGDLEVCTIATMITGGFCPTASAPTGDVVAAHHLSGLDLLRSELRNALA